MPDQINFINFATSCLRKKQTLRLPFAITKDCFLLWHLDQSGVMVWSDKPFPFKKNNVSSSMHSHTLTANKKLNVIFFFIFWS